MIRSCELKDTYLAGYLDDDRKLSFETAARAKLECNKGKTIFEGMVVYYTFIFRNQLYMYHCHKLLLYIAEPNCEGLTFEPKIGKWTLRASSDEMDSKDGEVSMLKSCLERMGNLIA